MNVSATATVAMTEITTDNDILREERERKQAPAEHRAAGEDCAARVLEGVLHGVLDVPPFVELLSEACEEE